MGWDSGVESAADGVETRPRPVEPGTEAEPRDAGPSKPPEGGAGAPEPARDEGSETLSLRPLPPRRRAAPDMMAVRLALNGGCSHWRPGQVNGKRKRSICRREYGRNIRGDGGQVERKAGRPASLGCLQCKIAQPLPPFFELRNESKCIIRCCCSSSQLYQKWNVG